MSKTKPLWKRMLSVVLLGAFAVAPLAGATIGRADPPNRDHDGGDHSQHDRGRDHGQQHDQNRDHGQNFSSGMDHHQFQPRNQDHADNWSHGNDRQHDWNRGHDQFRSHDDHFQDNHFRGNHFGNNHFGDNHFRNNHFVDNRWRDDNWHSSHGYIRHGSAWWWHGHDDAWWIDNGYWWNGSIWIIVGDTGDSYDDYGPFRDFTGVVAGIHGDQEFDIRINGDIYNVYTAGYVPYRLDDGDLVRVYGQRYGHNDIRNSNVKILRDN